MSDRALDEAGTPSDPIEDALVEGLRAWKSFPEKQLPYLAAALAVHVSAALRQEAHDGASADWKAEFEAERAVRIRYEDALRPFLDDPRKLGWLVEHMDMYDRICVEILAPLAKQTYEPDREVQRDVEHLRDALAADDSTDAATRTASGEVGGTGAEADTKAKAGHDATKRPVVATPPASAASVEPSGVTYEKVGPLTVRKGFDGSHEVVAEAPDETEAPATHMHRPGEPCRAGCSPRLPGPEKRMLGEPLFPHELTRLETPTKLDYDNRLCGATAAQEGDHDDRYCVRCEAIIDYIGRQEVLDVTGDSDPKGVR